MTAERAVGLRRFLPFARERVSPDERAAQYVKERRLRSEGSTWRDNYDVVQELVVPATLQDPEGNAKVLVMVYQDRGGGWGATAVPFNPNKKSTDPAVILGSATLLRVRNFDEATLAADGWVDDSAGPLNHGDTERMQMVSQLEGKYGQSIHRVKSNTP